MWKKHYYLSYYFPLALAFSVSPELKVLGTTHLLLWWVTAHAPRQPALPPGEVWPSQVSISTPSFISWLHLLSLIFPLYTLRCTLPPDNTALRTYSTCKRKVLQKIHKDMRTQWHSDSNTFPRNEKSTYLQSCAHRVTHMLQHINIHTKTEIQQKIKNKPDVTHPPSQTAHTKVERPWAYARFTCVCVYIV